MKFKLKGPDGLIEVYIPRSMIQLYVSIVRIVGYKTMNRSMMISYCILEKSLNLEEENLKSLRGCLKNVVELAKLIPVVDKAKELAVVKGLIPNPDTMVFDLTMDDFCLETEISTGTLALMFYDSLCSWVENPEKNEEITIELLEELFSFLGEIIK